VAPYEEPDRAARLAMTGFVTLFWRTEVLEDTLGWLLEHGYDVVRLPAAEWTSQADFHRDIRVALDFPDHYGNNLDALNDSLRDIAIEGTAPVGLVLVLAGYDAFARREPRAAQTILDITADQARTGALFGHRLLCLVQSDDPRLTFVPVGATAVAWNPAETRRGQNSDQPSRE
jgi:RNAse (barnase) inhibitor barstar